MHYHTIKYSPDYPILGYPTFAFIRHAVLERYILSTVTLHEVKQITPPTTTHLLHFVYTMASLFRRWCDLAAMKIKWAQTRIRNFLKNKHSFTNLYYVTLFWFVWKFFT